MIRHELIQEEYEQFCEFLQRASGIVLGEGKHYLVNSRLSRVIEGYKLASYRELIIELKTNIELRQHVIDAMTTNETMWFRDKSPFDILYNKIFPEYAKRQNRPFRLWSAACSSGQEPYSIAMLLHEFNLRNPGSFRAGSVIVATDISANALQDAVTGCYGEGALSRGLSEARKRRYLKCVGSAWEVKAEVKQKVKFMTLNLQDSYEDLGGFDVIFCRNVLIYFSSDAKTKILERMHNTLYPGGYIMLGSSETPSRYTDVFSMIKMPDGVIYQRR